MPPKQSTRRGAASPEPDDTEVLSLLFEERLKEMHALIEKEQEHALGQFPEVNPEEDDQATFPASESAAEDDDDTWKQEDEDEDVHGSKEGAYKDFLTVWKWSLRFFGCNPYDILSPKYHLTCPTINLDGRDYPDPMWADSFCKAMVRVMLNPVSGSHPGAFATIVQYAIICRKNDQRKWPLTNYTTDRFLDVFIDEVNRSPGNKSIVQLHDRVEERLAGLTLSPWSHLFRAVEEITFKKTTPPIRNTRKPTYAVEAVDLGNIEKALDQMQHPYAPPAASRETEAALLEMYTEDDNMWPSSHDEMLEAIEKSILSRMRSEKIAEKAKRKASLVPTGELDAPMDREGADEDDEKEAL